MPKHHVQTRPPPPILPESRGQSDSMCSSITKRKSLDSAEPTSEHGKRSRKSETRESNASKLSIVSVPETVLESEHESVVPPGRTSQNRSLDQGPVTPTPRLPSIIEATLQTSDERISTTIPPTTPIKPNAEVHNTALANPGATPMHLSSSNVDPTCVLMSETKSQMHRHPSVPEGPVRSQRSQWSMDSNSATQLHRPEMEEVMKHELHGNVFVHNNFFQEFFATDTGIQVDVRSRIETSGQLTPTSSLRSSNQKWIIDDKIAFQKKEENVYEPLAQMLNVIGRAAHSNYLARFPDDQFRQSYHQFYNHSSKDALRDYPSDTATKPDLVTSRQQNQSHWADMELLIECKSDSDLSSRNRAYLQLARYARAVFAHQIYRLRVFGFSLCGSIVNFVCFDRSGLLHSPDIDLSNPEDADSFVKHIITLLTIDADNFGYDTRFSFRQNDELSTVETLFKFGDSEPQVVSELLCYRKCCCGRATCVCALGDDVLKSIWRPNDRPDEGETLALFEGVFGVCQVKAFDYNRYSTQLQYNDDLARSPSASFFCPGKKTEKSSAQGKSGVAISVSTRSYASSLSAISGPVREGSMSRGVRIKSDILMPRGMSLFDARDSLHLLMAIHDALMGIMAFTEAGKIHCDISAYNLLLVDPTQHYGARGWLASPKILADPKTWTQAARDASTTASAILSDAQASISLCTCSRLKRAEDMERGPVCVVHDTEFTVDEKRTQKDVHTDRTGTPAFISAQLLASSASSSQPINRTFIHDVESLLWILVWVVAHRSHSQKKWEVNDAAKKLIRRLSQHDLHNLGHDKRAMLADSDQLEADILELKNDWCEDLAPVIGALAEFFYLYLYFKPSNKPSKQLQNSFHQTYTTESRSCTFSRVFEIINSSIQILSEKSQL